MLPGLGIFAVRYLDRLYQCTTYLLSTDDLELNYFLLGIKIIKQLYNVASLRLLQEDQIVLLYKQLFVAYSKVIIRQDHAFNREKAKVKDVVNQMKMTLIDLLLNFTNIFSKHVDYNFLNVFFLFNSTCI